MNITELAQMMCATAAIAGILLLSSQLKHRLKAMLF